MSDVTERLIEWLHRWWWKYRYHRYAKKMGWGYPINDFIKDSEIEFDTDPIDHFHEDWRTD